MNRYLFHIIIFLLLFRTVFAQNAEVERLKQKNLSYCLTGEYPSLCNYKLLSQSELKRVKEAEAKANFKICITGEYPSLCKYSLLTKEQTVAVRKAEKQANFKVCSSGSYPSLCKHEMLSPKQSIIVEKAEKQENFKTCISGITPTLCNYGLLTKEELLLVKKSEIENADKRKRLEKRFSNHQDKINNAQGCLDGHWISKVSSNGSIITLENGSLWEVDSIDTYKSILWLPISEIIVCQGVLINTDTGDKVLANKLN